MNSISQTLKFMLLHSKVNLIILLMLMVLVLSFQFKINMLEFPAMMLNSGVAIFLGVYLGGSYLKLKQNYLWLINDRYKLSLLFSFIIIIGVYNLIMSAVILKDMKSFQLLILPFCIAIFSSQIVLGKNLLIKVAIPIIPFIIVKYAYGNMHQSMVYALVIVATAVLLYSMYTGSIFSLKANKKSKNSKSANTVAFVTTGLSSSQLNSINHKIGTLFSKLINASKKAVAWSILMPHSKVLFIVLYYLILVSLSFFLFSNEQMKMMASSITFILFIFMFIGLIIEARHLISQTKAYAHVFTGKNHRQLKNKILLAIDKHLLGFTALFLVGVVFIYDINNFSIIDRFYLLTIAAIFLVTIAIYPLMLCMNWVNLSFGLVVVVYIYSHTIYEIVIWIKHNQDIAMSPLYVVSFILVALLVRLATQIVFWKKSIEELMKR